MSNPNDSKDKNNSTLSKSEAGKNIPKIMFQGKPLEQAKPKEVDLVFVIDTTGSMSDKIEGLLKTCKEFLQNFHHLGLNHRVSIIAFGDLTVEGDDIVATPFMTELEMIKRTLMKIPRYGGGGNVGESCLEALKSALRLSYRPGAVKAVVLVTDDAALTHKYQPQGITAELKQKEILTYVISPDAVYYREMANKTGGQWMEITSQLDFSKLLLMFQKLATDLAKVVHNVHRLAGGSVSTYLMLEEKNK